MKPGTVLYLVKLYYIERIYISMSKKLLVSAISMVLLLSLFTTPSYAFSFPFGGRKELRNEVKNDRKEIRDDRKDLKNDTKDLRKLNKHTEAKILEGKVKSKDGANLTVEKDGKTYTVQTDGKTQFRRHFWGKSSLDEISIGDKVNVHGKYVDDAQTTILAKLIRDVSITKRFGAFVGTVANLNGSTFTLNSVTRGAQKVTLDSNTKCVNRKEETINCASDVQNGHRVRVKGMLDKTNSTITEVMQVKDYSIPPKPTTTPKP